MSPASDLTLTQNALDFQGLGKLRGQARQDEGSAVRETAQQFEAMFIQQMMKTMRESIEKSELNESHAQETFEGMFDREVAHQMAKRGTFGIADMLVKDHERRSQMVTTAEALQAREAAPPTIKPLHMPETGYRLQDGPAKALPLPTRVLKPLNPFDTGAATGGRP